MGLLQALRLRPANGRDHRPLTTTTWTGKKERVMLTADIASMIDEWAIAWSSSANNDPERVLALFAGDGMYEDVTAGVVVRGKEDLRRYLIGAFATIPDLTFDEVAQRALERSVYAAAAAAFGRAAQLTVEHHVRAERLLAAADAAWLSATAPAADSEAPSAAQARCKAS